MKRRRNVRNSELAFMTTALWDVPQVICDVDQAQAHDPGRKSATDRTGRCRPSWVVYFVNYFNLFGLQWQVYIQAEGDYRMDT